MEILRKKAMETAMVLQDLDYAPVEKAVEILKKAKKEGKTVFTFGNGGSHCNAEHFATDLFKAVGIKALCFSNFNAIMTAYMNDCGKKWMFREFVNNLWQEGDVVIGFSCSGNSENISFALKSENGNRILFTGSDGGESANYTEITIKILHKEIRIQESCHSVLCHIIIDALLEDD